MSSGNSNIFTPEMSTLKQANQMHNSLKTISDNSKYNTSEYDTFVSNVVDQVIINPRQKWAPHINGWYYVNMVHGSWASYMTDETKRKGEDYKEFSSDAGILLPRAIKDMGHLIKDIDPTQLNIEYETISGRVRNIQNATRIMATSEFSITFKDTRELDMFRYHEFWYDYIDAYKKGFIASVNDDDLSTKSPFIKTPYLNAVWISIFKPFTYELQGLIKIMGISPTNLPIKDIIGQRSSPQVTTFSINYKAVDTIAVFYGDSVPSGKFYEEFLSDSRLFF